VEHLKLQVRMNTRAKAVEIRNSKLTPDVGAVQRGEDFVRAFALGFDVEVCRHLFSHACNVHVSDSSSVASFTGCIGNTTT
jgi:rRNA processing protein Krr1/Pno1